MKKNVRLEGKDDGERGVDGQEVNDHKAEEEAERKENEKYLEHVLDPLGLGAAALSAADLIDEHGLLRSQPPQSRIGRSEELRERLPLRVTGIVTVQADRIDVIIAGEHRLERVAGRLRPPTVGIDVRNPAEQDVVGANLLEDVVDAAP